MKLQIVVLLNLKNIEKYLDRIVQYDLLFCFGENLDKKKFTMCATSE